MFDLDNPISNLSKTVDPQATCTPNKVFKPIDEGDHHRWLRTYALCNQINTYHLKIPFHNDNRPFIAKT